MQIELFLVPPGNRDFRARLTDMAAKGTEGNDFSHILYLCPTRHLLRQWQRDFAARGGDCYIPPESATLRQYARRLFTSEDERLLIPHSHVPVAVSALTGASAGHSEKMAEFMGEMKNLFPGDPAHAIRKRVLDAFEDLSMPDEVSARSMAALEVMESYDATLKDKSACDEEDALEAASAIAGRKCRPKVLVLDGFYEVTPAELGLINALIENAQGRVLISVPISSELDDLSHSYSLDLQDRFGVEPQYLPGPEEKKELTCVSSRSKEEEVESIARHIKSAFVSGRNCNLDDTYVAFPSLADYREMVCRVFKRYGIPFCLTDPAPAIRTRPYRDVLELLEAVRDGFPRLKTARVLTSPYLRKIPKPLREATPQLALRAGEVLGRRRWMSAFSGAGLASEAEAFFSILDNLNPSESSTFAIFIKNLLYILEELIFMPDEDSPDSYRDVLRGIGLMGRIVSAEAEFGSHVDTMRAYLDGLRVSPEDTKGVRVTALAELRGTEPSHLYLGGLKDGDLPARPELDFLLPDSIRKRLGLVDMQRYLKLQGYVFRRLVNTAGSLRLSYPQQEADKLFLPSPFISDGQEVAERLYGAFSPEEDMVRRGREPLSSEISEVKGIRNTGEGKAIRVTDIDAYRRCPRRFFIERVLGLEPPEVQEYELEARTLGIIVHEVMERLIGPTLITREAMEKKARKVLDDVLEKQDIEPYFKSLIRESFLAALPGLHEMEEGLSSEGFRMWRTEYKVEGEPIEGIRLKGKVDRIDVKGENAAFVLDYKTGGAALSGKRALRDGDTLQPFLYSSMLKSQGLEPESAGIYSLRNTRINRIPNRNDIRDGRVLEEYIAAALRFLQSTVAAMRNGEYPASPLSGATCRRCHERPQCPYVQGASA